MILKWELCFWKETKIWKPLARLNKKKKEVQMKSDKGNIITTIT